MTRFNFKNIINYLLFKFKRRDKSDSIKIKPLFYWKVLILIFIFGLIILFFINLYFFQYFSRIRLNELAEKDDLKRGVQKEKVDELVRELDGRESKLLKLMKERTVIEEP